MLIAEGVDLRQLPPALQVIQVVDARGRGAAAWRALERALRELPPAAALPDPLPEPPPPPVSSLGTLRERIESMTPNPAEQGVLLAELKGMLAEPELAPPARELLTQLARHYNVLPAFYTEAHDLLRRQAEGAATAISGANAELAVSIAPLPPAASRTPETQIRYEAEVRDGATIITPHSPYLDQLAAGLPVHPLPPYLAWGWDWDLPALDVKVVNNMARTLFFTQAALRVTENDPDPAPLLLFSPDLSRNNALRAYIFNDGWSPAHDLTINFNFTPKIDKVDPPMDFYAAFAHTLRVGDLAEGTNLDLAPFFVAEGVDVMRLTHAEDDLAAAQGVTGDLRLYQGDTWFGMRPDGQEVRLYDDEELAAYRARFVGPFTTGEALMYGELYYTGATLDEGTREFHTRFYTTVYLWEERLSGAAIPVGPQYHAQLRAEGRGYTILVPISQAVKPGEVDRFSIRLGVPKSSRHRLTLDLVYNGGEHIVSPPIVLHAIIPRTCAEDMQALPAIQVTANK